MLPGLTWLALAPVKLAMGVAMALIAFGGEARFWRCAAVFLGTAALFGGAVFALSMAAGADAPGWALQRVTWRVLIPTFALCYAAVTTVFRSRMRAAERALLPVSLKLCGQTLALRAIRDSGNALCDPASGMRAAVLSAAAAEPVLGPQPR